MAIFNSYVSLPEGIYIMLYNVINYNYPSGTKYVFLRRYKKTLNQTPNTASEGAWIHRAYSWTPSVLSSGALLWLLLGGSSHLVSGL